MIITDRDISHECRMGFSIIVNYNAKDKIILFAIHFYSFQIKNLRKPGILIFRHESLIQKNLFNFVVITRELISEAIFQFSQNFSAFPQFSQKYFSGKWGKIK